MKYIEENSIINLTHVQEMIEMQKRKQILANHPYEIWTGKDGKWYTYLPDGENGRKKVKRSTKESVETRIIEYWREKTLNPTVREIFTTWVDDKLKYAEIVKGTHDRYVEYFDKYFKKIANEKIRDIDEEVIEDFVKGTIAEFRMTSKCFSNFRTLVFGIFKKAKKLKLITFSITEVMADMDISRRAFKPVFHSPEDQVYLTEEKEKVEEYLKNNPDMTNLGLLLMFKTGLRVGELAALKHCDVQDYALFVNRTEVRYKGEDGKAKFEVRDFPKTEAGVRYVILPEKYKWILDEILKLNPSGEYLLEKEYGNRIRTYEFRRRLKKICEEKVQIKSKSPHKVRKTYGTILIDSNVKESIITGAMGHTNIDMTKGHYYYNRSSIEEQRRELEKVADL